MTIKLGLSTLICIYILSAFSTTDSELVGKWQSIDKGDTIIMHLRSDSFMDIFRGKQIIRGDSLRSGGTLSYSTDYSKEPKHITFIAKMEKDGLVINSDTIKGIFKFENNDLLLCMGKSKKPRPTDFTLNKKLVYKRIQ